MSLTNTPAANRLHIGIFGNRNSGKSSLINAITNQDVALVSDNPGTTTDPVYKAMEIAGIGPCMFVDTAGFDDIGELGLKRINKTRKVLDKIDIAIVVITSTDFTLVHEWTSLIKEKDTPIILIINEFEGITDVDKIATLAQTEFGIAPIVVSAKSKQNVDLIKQKILELMPDDYENKSITARLVSPNDVVMLVMPQDIGAPKGRLILPQVQVTRDLLDNGCTVISITADNLDHALNTLKSPPDLIITDSQVFKLVFEKKPEQSKLTSFSILYAEYKGDLKEFVDGANAISSLTPDSKVLIAEACTHAPQTEDIGRIKLPKMLRERVGQGLQIDVVSGSDFPTDLDKYNLIVHCGACMFGRKHVMSRIRKAQKHGVAITNYGVCLAYLNNILDQITY